MNIFQFIMGFIMGIYLMEILNGYVFTKKVMAVGRRAGSRQGEG